MNRMLNKAMERKTSLRTTLRSLQLPFVFSTTFASACRAKAEVKKKWPFLINSLLLVNQTSLAPFHSERAAISPWFITGFTDAEGCFSILIQYNVKYKTN